MSEVIMPKMGDAMEEGTLLQWLKPDGSTVAVGDVIAEIETDKSNVEVEAEEAGVLHTQVQPGAVVPVGQPIATIGDKAAAPAKPAEAPKAVAAAPAAPKGVETSTWKPARPAAPVSAPTAGNNNGRERLKASPLARRVAREQGVDIARITGSGPNGRIIEVDVTDFLKTAATAPAAAPVATSSPAPAAPAAAPIKLSAMRRTIAKRMVESKTTIPHFYITAEVDMTEALALREKLNAYDETLVKISLNDFVVKASAKALVKVPAANASFKDDSIIPGNGINVGIAVALDDGLIVPVVRGADQLPLRKLAQNAKDLIKKARDGKLLLNDYTGGTFTVSNLGGFDVENFIAIIDPSQGAILAVSSIVKKPVVLADGVTIAVRDRMNITFSGDHRVMDGAVGAKLLQEIKRVLQNPLSLLEG
ncbi:acetyltransferase component of pyruvate dehydrogenase complex [Capsulimonas corticalis]|uniref:Dihydrolipoamide acetyltransferase component of pyruvate dehydrogenase complex n=1 Tax=Capsulimonas corticalis TaxID=2219043 RepID=A0A9N7L513_9BACT|nr:dihydrolipoamide acetyltransferase family protein [Capsulimonas corticalis]BDI31054.1 acetyltransferase component of pyruvate dehydrogenase complex [Capsulimonas corticalis]